MMLTGREVDGLEAESIGLVDRLVDGDVTAEALEYAARLAPFSGSAMEAIILCVDAGELLPDRGMAIEGDAVMRLFNGGAQEGLTKFLERRRAAS
jgi:enoyl-CoA hydratase/carnithine racemase